MRICFISKWITMWNRLILPKDNASLLGQDQIEQDDRLWIRPERFCQTRSPEDDAPEAFKGYQELSAATVQDSDQPCYEHLFSY